MKKIQILTITGIIILIGVVGFTIGRTTAPEKEVIIQGSPPCNAVKYGAVEPQSLAGMIIEQCQCPTTEPVIEVGCVDEIDANNVRVKNATKINIDGKKYNVVDIVREVLETSVINEIELFK